MVFEAGDRRMKAAGLHIDSLHRSRWWLAIGCIALLGFILRLAAIDAQSFWYDEAVSASLAQNSVWSLLSGTARDNGNPPLYWVLLSFVAQQVTPTEANLRLLSVVFGTMTIVVLAKLTRDVFGNAAGILAAVLYSISPFSLEFSTEARCYPLIQLLAAANMLFFIRWVETRRTSDGFYYVITLVLACLTHYFAIFIPIAQGLSLLLYRRNVRLWMAWLLCLVAAAALGAFWLPGFLSQMHTEGNLSRMADSWKNQFLGTPLVFSFGRTLAWRDSSSSTLSMALLAALVLMWLPAAKACLHSLSFTSGFMNAKNCLSPFAVGLVMFWLTTPIVLPLIAAFGGVTLYHHRAASVAFPAFIALASRGLVELKPRWSALLFGAILLLSTISDLNYFRQPLRDDWRSAATYVLARLEDSELVLFDSDIEVVSFQYYAKRQPDKDPEMLAIVSGPDKDSTIHGVRLPTTDRRVADHTVDVLQSQSFWLALCVPATEFDDYAKFFRNYGYRLDGQQHFHRIDIYHFVRDAGESVPVN